VFFINTGDNYKDIQRYKKNIMEKELLEKFDDKNAFIKVTEPSPVEGSDKAALNRKANQKFNEGDIEGARRIFMTTGYSDGLSRTGDFYKSKDRPLEALRMYWMGHDKNKSQPLIEQLSFVLQSLIHEEEDAAAAKEKRDASGKTAGDEIADDGTAEENANNTAVQGEK